MKRIALFNAVISMLLLVAFTRPVFAAHAAEQLVYETSEKVLARLKTDREELKTNSDLIYPLVEDLVLPHFDFHRMSIWVLGKNWRKADKAQRQQFTDEFRTLLVRTYATALLEYVDQNLHYLPFHAAEDAKKVTVKTEIQQRGGPSIPLYYSMYLNKTGEWKVYDIKVDGISLVSNYRSSFATEIRNGGVAKLLTKLAEMNKSAGSDAKGGNGE